MKHSRVSTATLVFAAFAALIALILAVLLIGEVVHLDGTATQEGSTRISLVILLFGEAVMVTLFAAFLFIGIEDWRQSLPISELYPPQIAVMGTMAAYMTVTGLAVIDLLTHRLRPTWGILYTPVARIFQSVLLLAVFASFAWVLATVVRGRSYDRAHGRGTFAVKRILIELREQMSILARRQGETERRVTAEEERNDRADATDIEQAIQDDHLEVTEDVLEIRHTVTEKTEHKGKIE